MKSIDQKYELLGSLGSGMAGEVFLVRDRQGREIALKFLKQWRPGSTETEALESFKREFGVLKDLNHPNIARILDFGREEEGRYYFTTEFIEGSDFFSATAGQGPEVVEEKIVQALRALEYLHARSVFHLDIKPANLLVTKQNQVKLIDFGLSGEKFGEKIAGTPSYMSPEVICGDIPDGRADLYSLGVLFYACLARDNPFRSASLPETLERQKKLIPTPISKVNGMVPDYLDRILERLLKKNRGERYLKASHVIRDINLLSGRNYPVETAETLLSYLPEEGAFIGRKEELVLARNFCLRLTNPDMTHRRATLWIQGGKGSGKTRFLKELKYFCQLNDVPVFFASEGELPLRAQPMILLLDDVDRWSTGVEERWFDFLQKAKGVALLTVMASSGPFQKSLPLLQPYMASSGLETVTLANLSKKELTDYLVSVTGLDLPPEALIEALFARTDGNPLFLSEILKTLIANQLLFDSQGRWKSVTLEDIGVDFSRLAIPDTLKGLLQKIFIDESSEARTILSVLALLRRPIRVGDFEKMTRLRSVREEIQTMTRKGWILHSEGGDEIALKNPLWRDVISESLSSTEREKVQDRIADWMEENGDTEAASLHWGEGSDPDKACQRLAPLAASYVQRGRGEEAVALFQTILKRGKDPEPRARINLYMDWGEAYLQSNDYAASLETFQKIRPLLSKIENRDEDIFYKADVHERLASVALKLRRTEEAKADIQAGLALLTDYRDDPIRRMILENDLGAVWCQEGLLDRAEAIFLKTKTDWEKLNRDDRFQVTNNDLGFLYLLKGHPRAVEALQDQLHFLEKLPRRYPEARCHYNLAEAWFARKNFLKTIQHYERCIALSKEIKAYDLLLRSYNGLGNVTSHHSGEKKIDEGIDYYLRALAIAQKLDDQSSQAALHSNLGILYQENRQIQEAEHHLLGAVRIVRALGQKSAYDLSYLARAQLELGSLLRGKKEFEKSRDHLRDAARLIEEHESLKGLRFWVLYELACLYRDQGRTEELQNGLKDLRAEATTAEQKEKLQELEPQRSEKKSEDGWKEGDALENLRSLADRMGFALVHQGEMEALRQRLDRTQEESSMTRSLLKEESLTFQTRYSYKNIVTRSRPMRDLFRVLDKVTDTPLAVLIRGETGTGKELVAKALHVNGPRHAKNFVAVNCGAIPAELMESELFGHKAGAFTGATRDKVGLCEAADGGTLFLDEVGELSPALQVKLLRFLQEKEFRRVGETEVRRVDVRVLAATHQDLEMKIREGTFREDLYFRLCEVQVTVPPLRERREDIPLLAEHLMEEYRSESKAPKKFKIDKGLLRRMVDYDWPGNVRELESFIRVACALSENNTLTSDSLPAHSPLAGKKAIKMGGGMSSSVSIDGKNLYRPSWTWEDYEKRFVAYAYRHNRFRAIPTAKSVGLTPPTLYRKIKEWKLDDPQCPLYEETFYYEPPATLEGFCQKVFRAALRHHQRPYAALRSLGVSQGFFYKVMKRTPEAHTPYLSRKKPV